MTIDEQFKLVDAMDDVICKCTKPYTLWITTLPYDCTGIYDPKIIETSNPIDGVMIHLLDDVDEQEIYIFINDEDKVKPIKNLLKPIDTMSRKASNIYFDITYYVLSDLYAALIKAQESSKNEGAKMTIDELKKAIADQLTEAIKIKLEPGECCPFCGRKRGSRKVSEKMLRANQENIKKALEARRKK